MIFLAGGYRLFRRYYVRDENIENPPYIGRLSVAFWSTLIRTLSLVSVPCYILFFCLSNFNVLRPDIAPILAAFFSFIGLVYFVGRLTNRRFCTFQATLAARQTVQQRRPFAQLVHAGDGRRQRS